MTRPPGASYAQFFPAAPRAARDRAVERDRERMRAQESPSTRVADTNGHHTPLGLSSPRADDGAVGAFPKSLTGLISKSHPNGSVADAALQPPDDTESLTGETLNTVGSASSHASTSSSLFSASTQHNAMSSVRNSNTYLTPLTTIDSPSSNVAAAVPTKGQSTTPLYVDDSAGVVNDSPAALPSSFERVPARDPRRSIKCIQCTYDPFLNKMITRAEQRKGKPIYKEFGLVRTLNTHIPEGGRRLCCETFG
jgi:[histone H3]-lysine4 N-trimethyltransferase SETD1